MFQGKANVLGSRVSDFTGSKGEPVSARYITLLCGESPIELGATQEAYDAAKEMPSNTPVVVELSLYKGFSKASSKEILKARVETLKAAAK